MVLGFRHNVLSPLLEELLYGRNRRLVTTLLRYGGSCILGIASQEKEMVWSCVISKIDYGADQGGHRDSESTYRYRVLDVFG
jgi:hypothetical protein